MIAPELLRQARIESVAHSLREDIGDGDITAMLIPAGKSATGRVITREPARLSGKDWVDEVFRQVDPSVELAWRYQDGDDVAADEIIFTMTGPARSLLIAERAALNWLQTLSGVATTCAGFAARVAHTKVRLLDTRKTIPGLRLAQKYAVTCGGCDNHRLGLWDAFLIKENHIAACGSIAGAINEARRIAPARPVEVETESMDELNQALDAGADIIMLDEFSLEDMAEAVRVTAGRARLEASGGINEHTLIPVAETGVDYISIGALTKDLRAIDLSMRLD
ncbi:carboxylating nicotinate-nucleotide diphosphorylase [Marinobacter halophilus]|uniref:Probable nicotinate-nucleotide pyrophosphorylase [carboxylating] n=1 Tax=Marinobacter halophilus TaxID=1323740 RepID=A0A2T1KIC6_9GAMM|nr:carboxylating nicotinate-nucleotide diphosphorylase [Marinobacter halophilus]PSF09760.1 nicotinate-nucleotide diphosphorylase (carboxylating) [Marinobacter halophilus]GGC79571.1 nicotinate-nucleotide diphosphorylase (carboxylating) [Marinobacter halophilus]